MLCCCWGPREHSRGGSFLNKVASEIPAVSFVGDVDREDVGRRSGAGGKVGVWFNVQRTFPQATNPGPALCAADATPGGLKR